MPPRKELLRRAEPIDRAADPAVSAWKRPVTETPGHAFGEQKAQKPAIQGFSRYLVTKEVCGHVKRGSIFDSRKISQNARENAWGREDYGAFNSDSKSTTLRCMGPAHRLPEKLPGVRGQGRGGSVMTASARELREVSGHEGVAADGDRLLTRRMHGDSTMKLPARAKRFSAATSARELTTRSSDAMFTHGGPRRAG